MYLNLAGRFAIDGEELMRHSFERGAMGKFALLAIALVVLLSNTAFAGTSPQQKTSGIAYVGVTHNEGSDLYVSGDIKDKLLGRGAIVYVTKLSTGPAPSSVLVKAKRITIYTKRGSLSGTGQATQVFNPDGSSDVQDGTFSLTKGTGAYAGHSMKGTFSGPFSDGVYTFSYKGVYK